MATSLEKLKKISFRSVNFTKNALIRRKDCESRPGRYRDNWSQFKKGKITQGEIYSPVGKFAEGAKNRVFLSER